MPNRAAPEQYAHRTLRPESSPSEAGPESRPFRGWIKALQKPQAPGSQALQRRAPRRASPPKTRIKGLQRRRPWPARGRIQGPSEATSVAHQSPKSRAFRGPSEGLQSRKSRAFRGDDCGGGDGGLLELAPGERRLPALYRAVKQALEERAPLLLELVLGPVFSFGPEIEGNADDVPAHGGEGATPRQRVS